MPYPVYGAQRINAIDWFCGDTCAGVDSVFRVNDLNNQGEVAGQSNYTSDGSQGAFLFTGGATLGPYLLRPGNNDGWESNALAVNEAGDVAGWSFDCCADTGATHPFVKARNAPIKDLGIFGDTSLCYPAVGPCRIGEARDINDAGDIVGFAEISPNGIEHAFLYSANIMHDLNDLIPTGSGWVLNRATRIDNDGTIYGNGRLNGQPATFVYKAGSVQTGSPPTPTNKWGQYLSGISIIDSNGETRQLTPLLEPGIAIDAAVKINDAGQILVATTSAFGPIDAWVLTDRTSPTCVVTGSGTTGGNRYTTLTANDPVSGIATIGTSNHAALESIGERAAAYRHPARRDAGAGDRQRQVLA